MQPQGTSNRDSWRHILIPASTGATISLRSRTTRDIVHPVLLGLNHGTRSSTPRAILIVLRHGRDGRGSPTSATSSGSGGRSSTHEREVSLRAERTTITTRISGKKAAVTLAHILLLCARHKHRALASDLLRLVRLAGLPEHRAHRDYETENHDPEENRHDQATRRQVVLAHHARHHPGVPGRGSRLRLADQARGALDDGRGGRGARWCGGPVDAGRGDAPGVGGLGGGLAD
jgi:hypothetical protein